MDLERMFATEEACRGYLARLRCLGGFCIVPAVTEAWYLQLVH
jgi:hypothetical protein